MDNPHACIIPCGAVTFERRGDEVAISSAKVPELVVMIPYRVLESWGLRKLREEALQPEHLD